MGMRAEIAPGGGAGTRRSNKRAAACQPRPGANADGLGFGFLRCRGIMCGILRGWSRGRSGGGGQGRWRS